jgi:hypothetical protein
MSSEIRPYGADRVSTQSIAAAIQPGSNRCPPGWVHTRRAPPAQARQSRQVRAPSSVVASGAAGQALWRLILESALGAG